MVLHLTHPEGGFGVTFNNDVTKDDVFYTTTSLHFVTGLVFSRRNVRTCGCPRSHWKTFRDLKLMFAGSRRAEQLTLRSQQRIVATVEDSVLR
jgi:hypothetical protein